MKYCGPQEEEKEKEKSDDSLFMRGSDDDDDDAYNDDDHQDDDDHQVSRRHDDEDHDETLLSSTPPTNTTIRERHYSFAEHQEELSPGRRYHHFNRQPQQQRQTTRNNETNNTSASVATDPQRIQMPTTTALSPSSSSTEQDESLSLPPQQSDEHHSNHPQPDSDANNNNNNSNSGDSNNTVPADQERQILLLMLLAQVCALHDPTPRTFTVHVLELFERGILDRQSIHFLFDLGLVPSSSSSTSSSLPRSPNNNLLMPSDAPAAASTDQQHQQALLPTIKPPVKETAASSSLTTSAASTTTDDDNKQLAMVTTTTRRAQMTYQLQRSLEASAIRSTLEQQEAEEERQQKQQQQRQARPGAAATDDAASPPSAAAGPQTASSLPPTRQRTSWAAEHHPLSLSRYIREFDEIALLSSGSFGQVFQAKCKMDLRDYAIKRVPFAATGYSRESVQQVVREVQCLAVCDHPHVVRYYTSWLEPSWMTGYGSTTAATSAAASEGSTTGSGISAATDDKHGGAGSKVISSKQKLLQDITHLIEGTGGCENLMDDLEAYFIDTGVRRLQHQQQPHHHRHFSLDASSDNSNSWISDQDFLDGEEYSDKWTIGGDDDSRRSSKDDSFLQDLYRPVRRSDSRSNTKRHQNHNISSSSDAGQWKPLHQQQKHHHRQHRGRRHKTKQNESFRYQICLFIQMQLCHPRSLADWIRERNRSALALTPCKRRLGPVAVIFSQIAHGLGHVHSKGIIHRDLKPANVFCSAEGNGLQFKIGDFGLSKLMRRVSGSSPKNQQQPYSRNNQHEDDHKHHHNLLLLENGAVTKTGQAEAGSSSNEKNGEPSWQDPLTAGIGTASYAAPEQVSTRSYGKEADIFSLGLMLLELVCVFTTEHERIQTFHDCRYRRKLPTGTHEQELFQELPVLAETILQCTDPNPEKRPTAQQLANLNLMDTSRSRSCTNGMVDDGASDERLAVAIVDNDTDETVEGHQQEESDFKQVSVLKTQLAEKDEQLKECQRVISEKDDMIADLRRQVHALQQQQEQRQTANNASNIRLGLGDVETESFFAEPAASCSSNSSSSDEGGL